MTETPAPRRVRVHHLREAKERAERITMLTAYDAPTAQIFDEADGTAMSVVGESDIGWLPNDRLWVDGRLLIPETRTVVSIGGTRVRSL